MTKFSNTTVFGQSVGTLSLYSSIVFSDEMIIEAYERCVNIKGEYNISYINAILKRWHEKGIKSMDALHESEAAAKNKTKTKSKKNKGKGSVFSVEGASFDVDKYKNSSLFDD